MCRIHVIFFSCKIKWLTRLQNIYIILYIVYNIITFNKTWDWSGELGLFFLVMKTHKKIAIVKDRKISVQSITSTIYMYYNRILSARLKGLKKKCFWKIDNRLKKKVYIQLNFGRQAVSYFSFKKCGISNSTESNVIFCELGPLSSFLIKVNTKILKTNNHIEPLKPALSLELIIIIKKFSLSLWILSFLNKNTLAISQ